MGSSILAALLLIGALVAILMSKQRLLMSLFCVAMISLGYIAGNDDTTFGKVVGSIIGGTIALVDWVSSWFQ
jgi:hypothetical protein